MTYTAAIAAKPTDLTLPVFDIIVGIVLLVGVIRGRKRGMSEELLDVLQWLTILVASALAYKPMGDFVAGYTHMGLLASYVVSYLSVAVVIKLIFTGIKRAVGEKLVHADAFGRMEYYLGMAAGAVRFACILLVIVSLIGARYVSANERAAQRKMQSDNFGTISFPTIASMQDTIFKESFSGRFIRQHLREHLIRPTPPDARPGSRLPLDRELDEVMGGK